MGIIIAPQGRLAPINEAYSHFIVAVENKPANGTTSKSYFTVVQGNTLTVVMFEKKIIF